jgi:adenosine deaminase CECR1
MRRPLLVVWSLSIAIIACASRTTPVTPDVYGDMQQYQQARAQLIERERARRLGASLILTPEEESANRRLMALKAKELERTRAYFPPAHSYLVEKTKQVMAESPVLEVMRRLPKGGVLHAHGSAMGDYRWLVDHVTYRPDAYMYVGEGTTPRGSLRIADQPPGDGWRLANALRAAAPDAKAFDEGIYRSITLGEEDLEAPDIWYEFVRGFTLTAGLIGHRSVRTEYWRNVLHALIDENVQYLESRSSSIDEALIRDARQRDGDFDVKFIPASGRANGREQVATMLAGVIELRQKHPDRVVGFDLVQEEDRTNSNLFFVEELLAARREAERRGLSLPLYLHSGETNWIDNENLYDAVLLGASRIGHGLALIKHPVLMEIVRARGIAIEVCPISNQILGYVPDLRNHPAVHYINAGFRVVLSPDDPAIMRHSFSHDFYVAFMAWGLDLRSLKQLAMNSLLYSAMTPAEKERALASWERKWMVFVKWLNTAHSE